MNRNLLEIIACPICKGKLQYKRADQELICKFDKLAFPIRDDIPVMVESRARNIQD